MGTLFGEHTDELFEGTVTARVQNGASTSRCLPANPTNQPNQPNQPLSVGTDQGLVHRAVAAGALDAIIPMLRSPSQTEREVAAKVRIYDTAGPAPYLELSGSLAFGPHAHHPAKASAHACRSWECSLRTRRSSTCSTPGMSSRRRPPLQQRQQRNKIIKRVLPPVFREALSIVQCQVVAKEQETF